jgi:hypothetical protein
MLHAALDASHAGWIKDDKIHMVSLSQRAIFNPRIAKKNGRFTVWSFAGNAIRHVWHKVSIDLMLPRLFNERIYFLFARTTSCHDFA